MQLTTFSRLRSFSIGLLVVISVTPLFGQEDSDPFGGVTVSAADASTAASKKEERSLEERLQTSKIDIDVGSEFTVDGMVSTIRDTHPDLNIIVGRNCGDMKIPPMQLSDVSVMAALNAVEYATESEVMLEFVGPDESILCLVVDPSIGGPEKATMSVFNVKNILVDTPEESFLSAIEIGLKINGDSSKNLKMTLHKDTMLMFVKGLRAEKQIVELIVDQLGGEPQRQGSFGGGGFGGGGLGGLGGAGLGLGGGTSDDGTKDKNGQSRGGGGRF